MTDSISNIIDFGEVFNQIRRSQRELINNEIVNFCKEAHTEEVCDCVAIIELIRCLPYPGEVQE